MAATSKSVPEQVVDVQTALAGKHAGFRPVHAKGVVSHAPARLPSAGVAAE